VFAHGAGEVGFMSGPLSCIYDMYQVRLVQPVGPLRLSCMLGRVVVVRVRVRVRAHRASRQTRHLNAP
jgi:hypothetical protein